MFHRRKGHASSSAWIASLIAAAGISAICCGRDHSLGVTSGAGGSSSSSSSTTAAQSATSASSGAGGTPEPAGPTKLTIVNGVNDYGAIRVCFLPYPDGDPAAVPWPSAAAGLAFAHAAPIDPISPTLPAGKDIEVVVLAGDLTKVSGKTCAEATAIAGSGGVGGGDAGPPAPIVATSLGVVPGAVLDAPRSLLLAPYGCLGGPGHDAKSAELGCGPDYTASTPTADMVVLGMSRILDPEHINLQVVNASAALYESDVRLATGFNNGMKWLVASSIAPGGIGPKPPFRSFSVANLGPVSKAGVITAPPGSSGEASSTPLTDAIANGTVTEGEIVDGKGLVLVAVGGYPGAPAQDFWHKLTFTLVKADP